MSIKNGKEIVDQIKKIKNDYEANLETNESIIQEKLSFLDRLNKLVTLILNDESISIYDVLTQENIEIWNIRRNTFKYKVKSFLTKNLSNSLYLLLLLTITAFLVSEALGFYAIDGILSTKTYVKAILTEVCFIFLSGYRSNTKVELVLVGALRVSIFCLMMFVITSQVLLDGTKDIGNTDSITEQVELIENQIKEKEKNIIYYRDVKKWSITTKQLIKDKDVLVNKLLELKQEQGKGSNSQVSKLIKYRMYGRAIFRIMLLFISVLITRRIFKF